MIKTFNDLLALIMVVGIIPALWVVHGIGLLELPEAVVGATILQWGLILQYFYRKVKSEIPKPLEK